MKKPLLCDIILKITLKGAFIMFRKLRHDYVINQVKNARLPEFPESEKVRMHIIFSGRVQKVGFRLEVAEFAKRLGFTGNIKNLENGSVDLEIQGERNKILFLIDYMKHLKRIRIDNMEKEEMPLDETETEFISDKND